MHFEAGAPGLSWWAHGPPGLGPPGARTLLCGPLRYADGTLPGAGGPGIPMGNAQGGVWRLLL